MSSEQPRRTSRGSTATAGASPAGSTIAIVIAVVAVLLAIVILRAIRDDDDPSGSGATTTSTTIGVTTTTAPTETTVPPLVTAGAKVVVANAAGVKGVAATLTTALQAKQFTMGTPANAGGAEVSLATSKIYYDPNVPAAKAVADSVGRLMGVTDIAALPAAIPTKEGKLEDGTTVLVMLGKDKATLTLDAMPGTPAAATPAAPAAASSSVG